MNRSILSVLFVLVTAACSSGLPSDPEAGAPVIKTDSELPIAVYDSDYAIQLEYSGGQAPYTFQLGSIPAELAWLNVDEQGVLWGRPDQELESGLNFSVTVADTRGKSTSSVLKLAVVKCAKEGENVDCFFAAADGVCMQNSVLCTDGTYGTCDPASARRSLNTAHCGSSDGVSGLCGSCSPSAADGCDGICMCGRNPSCSGSTAACCEGTCIDLAADVSSCGTCGNACPSSGPAGSHAVCNYGTCEWACDAGKSECSSACVDLTRDPKNCGTCGKTCSAEQLCSAGQCATACVDGYTPCDGQCVYTPDDPEHCGSCTTVCRAPTNGTASCEQSNCKKNCPLAGTKLCGDACISVSSDISNCGNCGAVCSLPVGAPPGATPKCSSGTCGWACPGDAPYCFALDACVPAQTCSGGDDCCPITPCFVEGTPITLADGISKPIEEIIPGEQVLSFDVERKVHAVGIVKQLFVHEGTPALLRINDTLTTTPDHPFFVNESWIRAEEITIGDLLLRADHLEDGQPLFEPVVQLELLPGGVTTYNLEVSGDHDYFADGLLVHNKPPEPTDVICVCSIEK
jgi:hypothetical protein